MCPHFIYSWQSMLLFGMTGTLLGALGGGGSLLALPVFLLVLNVPHELAVPATSAVVGIAALSGAWDAWREKQLDLGTLARFAIPSMIFSILGSVATRWIPEALLHWIFLAILFYSAFRMVLAKRIQRNVPEHGTNGKRLVAAGSGTGLLMGFFGVGGGFIATPALVLEGGLTAAAAIPVTLGTIALSAASSLAVQIPSGTFRWTLVLPALIATLIGMEIGRDVSRRIPSAGLTRGFGLLLSGVAIWMLVRQVAGH